MMYKDGNWHLVYRVVNNLDNDMRKASDIALKQVGLYAEKEAKQHISRQDLNWEPLKKTENGYDYRNLKMRGGFSSKILVRTSSYFQAITSFVIGDIAFAGVRRTETSKDGENIANIAAIHEYGSPVRNIPKRPLWKPVFKEAREYFLGEGSVLAIFRKIILTRYGI